MTRLIDLMCHRHQHLLITGRFWPADYIPGNHQPGNNSCHDCGIIGATRPYGPIHADTPGVNPTEEAAIHEAGHAVAYLTHNIHVDYASLAPGDAEGSRAHLSVLLGDSLNTTAHRIGLWAGQSATLLWLDRQGLLDDAARIDVAWNAGLDSRDLWDCGVEAGVHDPARDDADRLVADRWDAIERVADMLLARGRLSGDEIAELAGFAGCNR